MTTPLWTSSEMEQATQGRAEGAFTASGVSIDTRTLKKGEAYLALKGVQLDGHSFVEAAFKAGASCAVVNESFQAASPAWPLLRVKDTQEALENLGRAARARTKAVVIGVTGSAGKTGTKEMLSIALAPSGLTHASKKSFNNHWGLPLTLANLPPDAAFAVLEMGMNHAGELTKLSAQARPHIAVITTIEPAHIEYFKTLEAIADAKAEIFSGMEKGRTAILNRDNPQFRRLKNAAEKQGLKIVSFGEDEEAEAHLEDCALHADSSRVTAKILGAPLKYRLNIPGKHIVMNSLAALAVVKAAGGDLHKAVEALKNSEPVEGRGNRLSVQLPGGGAPVIIIDESYNANPASMAAALSVLEMAQPKEGGRRIAVLGDMLELGAEGPRLHAGLANPLLKARADLVFCCGPQMDALYQQLPEGWRGAHTNDSRDLAPQVAQSVRPGDVVLVKGSKSVRMGYVIEALQQLQAKENRNAV
jgi:UDP-N-acetylmuramoyl-tripeptide--D-alanyl-D-alanine ligase